jgi:putative copper export protein
VRLIQLASVSMHVLAAAAWFGSMVFLVVALIPALRDREARERRQLLSGAASRLRRFIWPLFALLAATGVLQLALRGYRWSDVTGPMWEGAAGRALGVKLALVALALAVSAAHDFVVGPRAAAAVEGSPERERARRLAALLGRTAMALAVGIVAAAVVYVRGGIRP